MSGNFYTAAAVHKLLAIDDEAAIELFRKLLWAESWRLGITRSQVHVPSAGSVPDGGIDASVDQGADGNVILSGPVRYQIKTGNNFKPWQISKLRKELFEKGSKSWGKTSLKEGVRACLEENGMYVLVCFGHELTDGNRRTAQKHLEQLFDACSHPRQQFRVWDASDIVGFLEQYPALAAEAVGWAVAPALSHADWASTAEMLRPLETGGEQQKFLAVLAEQLRQPGVLHVRILGEPGIGKTRLVLEATRDEDLAPVVLYWENGTAFLRSNPIFDRILAGELPRPAILVVDDCGADDRGTIWNRLEHQSARVKLITIDHEPDMASGIGMFVPEVPRLAEEQIGAILRDYGVPEPMVFHFAALCEGSPRVAHIVGANLKANERDIMAPLPTMVDVWRRCIASRKQEGDERMIVAQYIALFKRFGFGPAVSAEAEAIAALVQRDHPAITPAKFHKLIKELQERRILQGKTTCYITPKLLHIWLWSQWWENYGGGCNIADLLQRMPGRLLEWFAEMFRYAEGSRAASEQVANLLGDGGPFRSKQVLGTELGARFFLSLAEARPGEALARAEAVLGSCGPDELANLGEGRQWLVWALEKIAYMREHFLTAARLLRALGAAENESSPDIASRVFTGLFSLGPGVVAPSEAPPDERFPVLAEALDSESKAERTLALRACGEALKCDTWHRAVGPEFRGLSRPRQPWTPATNGEFTAALQRVWQLVDNRRLSLPTPDERSAAVRILLEHAPLVVEIDQLSDMVVTTLAGLAVAPECPAKPLTETVVRIRSFRERDLTSAASQRLQELNERLAGNDFSSRLRRFVGMVIWDERMDEEGARGAQERVAELARLGFDEPQLLERELPWLVGREPENAYYFGVELAKVDSANRLLPRIVEAQRDAGADGSVEFLSGYLRVVHQRDPNGWESELDQVASDTTLAPRIAEITWKTGISDRAARRVLECARRHLFPSAHFRQWTSGIEVRKLREPLFLEWIRFLADENSLESVSIALELFAKYYCSEDSPVPPVDLATSLLLHDAWFANHRPSDRTRRDVPWYDWAEVAKRIVDLFPDNALDILENVVARADHYGSVLNRSDRRVIEVLDNIVRQSPAGAWERLQRFLSDAGSTRSFEIMRWLQGRRDLFASECSGPLAAIPVQAVLAWVEGDVNERAPLLAGFAGKTLDRAKGGSLTRELLVRYGGLKSVQDAFLGNFGSEGWWGPDSEHFERRLEIARAWQAQETDGNVRHWIDRYVRSIETQLSKALVREERDE